MHPTLPIPALSLLILAACAPGGDSSLAPAAAPGAPAPMDRASWETEMMPRLLAETRAFRAGLDGALWSDGPWMTAHFDGARMVAQGAGRSSSLAITLSGYGRSDLAEVPAVEAVPGACGEQVDTQGACVPRAELARDGITEWWSARGEGLEQGFDLSAAPDGDGPVRIALDVEGADVSVADGVATLIDGDGQTWTYGQLYAWDADGVPLPITLVEDEGQLVLEVDDSDARWPLTVDPLLTTASTTITGSSSNYLGFDVAGIGDVNNDGYADIAVSTPYYYYYYGRVWVFHGGSSGISSTASTTLTGPWWYSYFGYSIDGAGDVNNDGYDDLVVGIPGWDSAYVYHGSSSGIASSVETELEGSEDSNFGWSVAGLGDVNKDGYADVAVGAPYRDSYKGRVYVYHGSSSGLSDSSSRRLDGSSNTMLGYAVGRAGDVNNDGYDDLIVGAPYTSASSYGRAYVIHGSSSGIGSSASTTITASSTGTYLGAAVDGAGDVNNDGYDDVIVGAPYYSSYAGRAYVHHGSSSGVSSTTTTTITGSSSSYLGISVAGAGDVNADNYGDVVIGAYGYSSGAGAVYLHEGSSTGTSSTARTTLTGSSSSYFGYSADGAGDVNNDGYDDVVVGAPYYSSTYGRAYVYHGYEDRDGDGSYSLSDCNDNDAAIYPGATEVCDGVDNDCDGSIDESGATGGSTWYRDADGDSYGLSSSTTVACSAPSGYVANATDCNDGSASINPGATETCNSVDDDCDGSIDEDGATGGSTWYADSDSDGYGNASSSTSSCSMPTGYVANAVDCDDTRSSVSPAATETCATTYDDDCDGTANENGALGSTTYYADADGDTYGNASSTVAACSLPSGYATNSTDCNDTTAAANPAATESCDGIDNDCDGSADEAGASGSTTWYDDDDSDGYGDPSDIVVLCSAPSGFVSVGGDCNDATATANPAQSESCDTIDNDCDGSIDEAGASGEKTWYRDADSDLYGDATTSTVSCDAPSGYITNATDCDDVNAAVYPSAPEVCDAVDNDCDGSIDESGGSADWYRDLDGDGYGDPLVKVTSASCSQPTGYVGNALDCNDSNAAISPADDEVCDSVDNDCDGVVDEGDAIDADFWYDDVDGDGFGDPNSEASACAMPSGMIADGTDCDDSDADVSPDGTETCDGRDEDCDGDVDESGALGEVEWYPDADGDGFGTGTTTVLACDAPTGYAANNNDCDDTASAVSPLAAEVCDLIDNDCDGSVDEAGARGSSTFYADTDGDGYGTASSTTAACSVPSGYSTSSTDCNDSEASAYPGAPEVCDSIDNDCDSLVDEAGALDEPTWYRDNDADGFGTDDATVVTCYALSGYAEVGGDCDDVDSAVSPAAIESCNSIDDDCDGSVDEAGASGGDTFFADTDGDGFGDPTSTTNACVAPTGYLADGTDCDDGAADVNPLAAESCNGFDDDCDELVDEAGSLGEGSWYSDLDGDGYGDGDSAISACTPPEGTIATAGDCDDGDAEISPAGFEVCNGLDDDCDLTADESGSFGESAWYADVDGDAFGDDSTELFACDGPDGYIATGGDCADTMSTSYPGAPEVCDGADNDCDGEADEEGAFGASTYYFDADLDGFGDAAMTATGCVAPEGYVALGTDCDDADAAYYPGATETCSDTEDFNCDGSIGAVDGDGDGFAACVECNDADAAVNPDADEVCNGVDDNCDGVVDTDAVDPLLWYQDMDADGFGDTLVTVAQCDAPEGFVSTDGDCDDTDAAYYPGAPETCDDNADYNCDGSLGEEDNDGDGFVACEDCDDADPAVFPDAAEVCNGIDDNCNGITDGATTVDILTWYFDADSDGYGDAAASVTSCTQPAGYVANPDDCDDSDPMYNPAAAEACTDTVDYNCDGSLGRDDNDGDGWAACEECDDGDAAISPSAIEVCDGRDNDCDGETDGEDATGATVWYRDADRDGYGNDSSSLSACAQPSSSYVAVGGDCDDLSPEYNPGAEETDCADPNDYNCDGSVGFDDLDGDGSPACEDCDDGDASKSPAADEICNEEDDDCDGIVDDGATLTFFLDRDEDGYGDPVATAAACSAPEGYVDNDADCDDTSDLYNPSADESDCTDPNDYNCDGSVGYADMDGDSWVACQDCNDSDVGTNPVATEVCDDADNDCDGYTDEGLTSTYYRDLDRDGYGDAGSPDRLCTVTDGYSADSTDCDDGDSSIYPGAPEECVDSVDKNCDGSVGGVDNDGDGVIACDDCDDTRADVLPDAVELCDEIDNNCDGAIDEDVTSTYWWDVDGDGWGDNFVSIEACALPEGYAEVNGDCDDNSDRFYPGAEETDCADPADYNCDGSVGYADADADGWAACQECDDADAAVSPEAAEVCNSVDDDCDGGIDEEVTVVGYADVDGDGFGDPEAPTDVCSFDDSVVEDNTDCNDADAAVYPGAAEIADDGIDQDCDNADSTTDDTGDTGNPDDTGDPIGEIPDTGEKVEDPGGCSCSTPSGGASAVGLIGLFALVFRRRR